MAQISVNVRWRDIALLEDAKLIDVEGTSAFLRTRAPMPVGTMLIVSPVENDEVRVPARVSRVIEAPEAGSSESPGMQVSLEAAAEMLEPYLGEAVPVVDLAPEPAFDGGEPDLEQDGEDHGRARAPVPAAEEGDLPEAPRVQLDLADSPRTKKDSGVMPSASGEISMGENGDRAGDPDAPDKVIVMVDAEPPGADDEPVQIESAPEAEQREAAAGSSGEEGQQEAAAGPGEDQEPEEPAADSDEDKPKKKKRGKRRKKKKK